MRGANAIDEGGSGRARCDVGGEFGEEGRDLDRLLERWRVPDSRQHLDPRAGYLPVGRDDARIHELTAVPWMSMSGMPVAASRS